MKDFEYTVQDQLGIHARPAGQIAKLAKGTPQIARSVLLRSAAPKQQTLPV